MLLMGCSSSGCRSGCLRQLSHSAPRPRCLLIWLSPSPIVSVSPGLPSWLSFQPRRNDLVANITSPFASRAEQTSNCKGLNLIRCTTRDFSTWVFPRILFLSLHMCLSGFTSIIFVIFSLFPSNAWRVNPFLYLAVVNNACYIDWFFQ